MLFFLGARRAKNFFLYCTPFGLAKLFVVPLVCARRAKKMFSLLYLFLLRKCFCCTPSESEFFEVLCVSVFDHFSVACDWVVDSRGGRRTDRGGPPPPPNPPHRFRLRRYGRRILSWGGAVLNHFKKFARRANFLK